MLKKEFKKKDVNRARNLIMGKTNASTGTQIGYSKKQIEYKEGDIWTENKKTWTIKNGIKQTISKLDKIKKEVFMPLCCPECGNVMKSQLDKPNYRIHKKCHDCVVKFEHKLRHTGKLDGYKKKLKLKNSLSLIDEVESYLLETANAKAESFVSERGEVERWVGGVDNKEFIKKLNKTTTEVREKIKKELND